MSKSKQDILRTLPKVDIVLAGENAKALINEYTLDTVTEAIRDNLESQRFLILEGTFDAFNDESFWEGVENCCNAIHNPTLKRVINATGIVLHTNLGRAPLAREALAAIHETASGYSNLEYNEMLGERGSRYAHVEDILCRLTGAEAALVVNNNAAAVMLAVNTLAKDGEVVTSRGELIEIGGSFRIPDVIERSEAELVEVGATNKTRVGDYASAITNKTRILLKVHTSNYKIIGFTEKASREELVTLAADTDLVVVEDLGSGTLINTEDYGLDHEPTPQEVLATGVDIVTFSGDKLLGGPQAGILCGKLELIDRMKKNPLLRALRMDKLTLAALDATLRLYLNPENARQSIPILAMLHATQEELNFKALELNTRLGDIEEITCTIESGESFAGGGSLPEQTLPTRMVSIQSSKYPPDKLDFALSLCEIPIVGRIHNNAFIIDVRTLLDDDIDYIVQAFQEIHV